MLSKGCLSDEKGLSPIADCIIKDCRSKCCLSDEVGAGAGIAQWFRD